MLRCLALLLSLAFSLGAHASQPTDAAEEAELERSLSKLAPAQVAPFRQARAALDRHDYAEGARLLEPVCAAVPGFEAARRRLALCLSELGRRPEALRHAEKAVDLYPSAHNLSSLAEVLAFSKGAQPSEDDCWRAVRLLQRAEKLPGGEEPGVLVPLAALALRVEDQGIAGGVVEKLLRLYPELMQSHYFAALVAANSEHWIRAKHEILQAQKLGLPAATVQGFLDSGVGSRATTWQAASLVGWTVGAWIGGLGLLYLLGRALSRITLRHIETGDASLPVSPHEHRLRRVYRTVLNLAGIYYYLSLPIVLLLVLGLCAGCFYFFLLIGHIPIKLVALLAIGALMTVWSMLRSLFLKIPTYTPGRVLERAEAEDLWRLAEEVAAELKTRPVDEIRITGGTELCVYERGSWREKLQNRARRILVLGAALLPDFRQEDFRCVLAHEYGHFAHRDTAGGDVAMRVQNDMVKFYRAMYAAGQATKFNVAFQFLRLYSFLFRRISHGATRLQEVLSDRFAAQAYGAAAFEGGLRHVIAQSIRFEVRANREVQDAIAAARPLGNLYALPAGQPAAEEEAFQKALNRRTTEDDTHPGPLDRFRYLAKVAAPQRPPSEGVVWELFRDPAAILREMNENIEKQIAPHRPAPLTGT